MNFRDVASQLSWQCVGPAKPVTYLARGLRGACQRGGRASGQAGA
jgi:hypothetical protein